MELLRERKIRRKKLHMQTASNCHQPTQRNPTATITPILPLLPPPPFCNLTRLMNTLLANTILVFPITIHASWFSFMAVLHVLISVMALSFGFTLSSSFFYYFYYFLLFAIKKLRSTIVFAIIRLQKMQQSPSLHSVG